MLKNYFTIAWRNITRHRIHTAINVTGLALGMTCCLFIFLWVEDEKGIDNFYPEGQNLYTAYQSVTADGKTSGSYTTPVRYTDHIIFALEDIKAVVPEIKQQAFYQTGYQLPWGHAESFRVGDKMLKLEGSRASEDFFTTLHMPLLEGDAATALRDVNTIVLSRKMAEQFFGSPAAAIGKTIRYENRLNFAVTGVFENLSASSSLRHEFLISWKTQEKGQLEYSSNDFRTFFRLSPTADANLTADKINQVLRTRQEQKTGISVKIGLQRYGDQYLHAIFVNGRPVSGRIEYVRLFSGVAIFILIIACINFMNLATARSVKRAKEIGLRKVIGSTRGGLIGQFLGEALVFSFLAMALSILFLFILLPAFNQFTGKAITSPLIHPSFWISTLVLALVTGLVAGSYPALYLSSLQPIRVIKGTMRFSQTAIWFRKGLTVFQFTLSIVLIIATIVITRQTNYVQNAHLGYDRENLIYVRIEGNLTKLNNYLSFKEQASRMPGIALIDRSTEAPHAMDFVVADDIHWEGQQKNQSVGFKPASVGFDFLKLMNLKIAEGRDFSRQNALDSSDAFMVNEEAVREMGMKDPIGKWVSAWKKKGHIIAVLKDYHTHSLHEPIKPIIIDVKEYEDFGVIMVRTQPGKTKEALASLATVYKNTNPDYAFAFQFVDEEYKKLYNSELIISQLSVVFASLAILISCLGLLGLVLFAAEQRVKEIGIRKVLGASLGQILTLFSQDFLLLILIAFLIAAPLAWYFLHQWLQDFAYKITMSWWIFALAGGSAVFIALLTMSYQAVKAALANPTKSLRAE